MNCHQSSRVVLALATLAALTFCGTGRAEDRVSSETVQRLLTAMQDEGAITEGFSAWLAERARESPALLMGKNEVLCLWSNCVHEVRTNEAVARVVSEGLTESDAREALAFYGTPAGQKLRTLDARIVALQTALVGERLLSHAEELGLIARGHTYAEARDVALRRECFDRLRMIDVAKEHWATAKTKSDGALATPADLGPYMKDGFPASPEGGKWIIGPVGQPSKASFPEWEMDAAQLDSYLRRHVKEN